MPVTKVWRDANSVPECELCKLGIQKSYIYNVFSIDTVREDLHYLSPYDKTVTLKMKLSDIAKDMGVLVKETAIPHLVSHEAKLKIVFLDKEHIHYQGNKICYTGTLLLS